MFNMFDRVIANRQTLAAYVVRIHGWRHTPAVMLHKVGIGCMYIKFTRPISNTPYKLLHRYVLFTCIASAARSLKVAVVLSNLSL